MPQYSISICPLRLTAHFCRQGAVYVVLMSRKGTEFATEPSVCGGNNEVIFSDIDGIERARVFEVGFFTPKDKKNISFGIYDFTNRKNPAKLTGFEIPLAGMCSVLAGESMCEKKGISFRVGGHPGRLDVIFRMHPSGTPAPVLRAGPEPTRGDTSSQGGPKRDAAWTPPPASADGGAGSDDSKRTTLLPARAVDALIDAGILPSSVDAVELDLDLANEIAARTSILFPDERDMRDRIKVLEREIAQLEYEAQYAEKDKVATGSAAAKALMNESKYWKEKAAEIDEKSAHIAGIAPRPVSKDEKLTPQQRAMISETEDQLSRKRGQMRQLEAMQSHRDVTKDVLKLLDEIDHLENTLMDIKKHTADSTPRPVERDVAANGDRWDKLAAKLYDAEASTEEMRQTILALNRLQYEPYPAGVETGFMHEVPKELQFVKDNKRKPSNLPPTLGAPSGAPAPTPGTQAAKPPSAGDFLDDLFGAPAPQPQIQAQQSMTMAPAASPFDAATYSAPKASTVAPVWASSPAGTTPANPAPAGPATPQSPGQPSTAVANKKVEPFDPFATAPPAVSPVQPREPSASPVAFPSISPKMPAGASQDPVMLPETRVGLNRSTNSLSGAALQAAPQPGMAPSTQANPQSPLRNPQQVPPQQAQPQQAQPQQAQPHQQPPYNPPAQAQPPSQYGQQPQGQPHQAQYPSPQQPQQQQQQQHQQPDYAQQQLQQMEQQKRGPQQQQQQQQQQAPQSPPVPRFDRRPPSLDEIPFAAFPNTPLLARGCPIDIYLDGKTPTRGTEITIINNADFMVTVGGVELRQEDVFASGPDSAKTVPTMRWPQQIQIPGGGSRSTFIIAMHPSFPRASSVMMMVVIYVLAEGQYTPYTSRFSV